jgi:hypothetical protein
MPIATLKKQIRESLTSEEVVEATMKYLAPTPFFDDLLEDEHRDEVLALLSSIACAVYNSKKGDVDGF